MRKFAFLILLVFVTSTIQAQDMCCAISATAEFAQMAQDPGFAMLHEVPEPYTHQSAKGEMISFPTSDGQTGAAFYLKASEDSKKYLFVVHEWWGLNDHIKKEAERLFTELEDVHVLALDLYDGKVATNRDEAMTYIRAVDSDRASAIISGASAFAGSDAKIATIGWCFGGGWSLQAALLGGTKTVGCVIYYGRPEKDVEKLKTLNSDVLGIFALHDGGLGPDVVSEFQKNMIAAEKSITIHSFDAAHAFANPSSPRYKEEAAQTANNLVLTYLQKRLN